MVVIFEIIWSKRNHITHGSSSLSLQEASKLLNSTAKAHWNCQVSKSLIAGNTLPQSWSCPRIGWLKVNSDCRFVNDIAYSAFIIRNHNGSIVYAHAQDHYCSSPLVAEIFGILDACKFINEVVKCIFIHLIVPFNWSFWCVLMIIGA
ncbi:hypothetical protein ABFS83_13G045400 [Erythranthe nasuta]